MVKNGRGEEIWKHKYICIYVKIMCLSNSDRFPKKSDNSTLNKLRKGKEKIKRDSGRGKKKSSDTHSHKHAHILYHIIIQTNTHPYHIHCILAYSQKYIHVYKDDE